MKKSTILLLAMLLIAFTSCKDYSIDLTESAVEMMVGETYQINYSSDADVTFTSSNTEVVTVSDIGLLTAISKGTATIKLENKKDDASIYVSVGESALSSPVAKISKIYESDEDESKHLIESWSWNGEFLFKIEYYNDNGSLDDNYSIEYENGLLTKATSLIDYDYFLFCYQDSILDKIEWYWDGSVEYAFSFAYKDGKVSTINYLEYGKRANEKSTFLLSHFISPNLKSIFSESRKGRESSATYTLTWDNDNISNIKIVENSSSIEANLSYEYNSYLDPYHNLFFPEKSIFSVFGLSKNCVDKITEVEGSYQSITNYSYTVINNLPLTITETESDKTADTETWYFEYLE